MPEWVGYRRENRNGLLFHILSFRRADNPYLHDAERVEVFRMCQCLFFAMGHPHRVEAEWLPPRHPWEVVPDVRIPNTPRRDR